MPTPDTAVGAILEIPPSALQDIQKAERYITNLQITSKRAAEAVKTHWGTIATEGLGTFIQKLADAQNAMKGMSGGKLDLTINTESATNQMSNLTEKVQSDSSKISQSIQDLASIPIDAKGIKEWAETYNKTFGDVLGMIKGLKNGLREMGTESPTTQAQLQAIKAWEDYYKSVSKVNEEKGKMARKTADIERAISNVRAQIDHENQAWERSKTKVAELQAQMEAFNKVNPNFNYLKSTFELDELKSKLLELQHVRYKASEENKPLYDFKIEATKKQIDELTAKMAEYSRIYNELSRVQKGPNTEELTKKLSELEQKLTSARSAQASFNAELEKGNTAKSLASEYAKLTKRLQEVNDAMTKFQAAGGNVNSASFQALQTEWQNIMARRKEIEKMDIAEVNQYRLQMNQSAYQQDLSAWVQNEAQKKAASLQAIQETNTKRQEAWQRYLQSYEGAMKQVNALSSGRKSGQYTDTFENRARVIKNLEAAIRSLKTTDADYEKKLKDLTDVLNRLKSAQDAVKTAMKPVISSQDALNMAKNATTLRELEAAYKSLKSAMSATDPTSTKWADMNTQLQKTKTTIDEIKKKMGEFKEQSVNVAGVVGQLRNQIAAAFSIGAINGFIKKMVETRAQFELQRVALGAIIQDRDEANKVFTQVQNMALESPFSIMQLEKATKQIAAFGFEAKKLVPTMKMFADISAGLGVEIDRLVLVMGHLKARNYLEGTMVRQFTNMGFNILGNLADYYSELENKMVSVGEVQERVKKKMVSFADVEEVLKRVTSAGGMFYDMQKKQSDSIWGQMQRIKDAYDLMLNEIGQSNESSIKGALTLIRTLINSWRTLLPIIQATGAAIVVYFSVSRWGAITAGVGGVVQAFKNMRTAVWGAKAAQDALNASQKASGWGLLISLIAAATVAIYEFATAQSKLTEAMDRVRSEGIGNMYDLIYQYQKLADAVRDTNTPYEEQKNALDEIKRVYADILPDEMLEIENIKAMSKGYEEATAAIKAYSAEKTKANLKAEIENIVGKDIQSEEGELADWMATFLELWKELPDKMSKDTFRTIAKTMITEISEEVKNGEIPVGEAVDELKKRMRDRLKNIMPKDALDDLFKQLESRNKGFGETYFEDWQNNLQKFQDQIKGIDIGFDGAESPALVEAKKNYENLTNAVNEYKKAIEALRLAREAGQVKGDITQGADGKFTADTDGQMGLKALENLNKAHQELEAQVRRYGPTWKATTDEVNAAIESQTGQMKYFEQTNTNVFTRILSGLDRWQARFRNDDSVRAWVERTLKEADKLDLSDVQNKILDVALSVIKANGMQVGSLDRLRLASLNCFGDAAKAAQGVYNQLAANEVAIRTQINTLTQYGYTAAKAKSLAEAEFGAGLTMEEIKEMMELYKELIPAFGGTLKEKKTGGKGKDPWQDRLSLFKEINTEYEKLLKNYSEEESKQRIQMSYAKAVAEIFKGQGKFGDIKNWLGFDKESMIKVGQQMLDSLSISPQKRKDMEKQLAGLKAEVDVHIQEDAVKEMEKYMQKVADNFELSETFRNLGVPIELTYSLGGKPTTLADQRRELEDNYYEIFKVQKKYGDEGEKAYDKIQQDIAKKEQKNLEERAKNYIKYLTESMGERAQIEIKAMQDVNKIREDETLDSFSKEQAIMQRRKKMYEELSKADLDSLKSSDVYISVFKDLEKASKEQLQYVLNKLRELQSTFKDLSPAQVKSIANEMKKIEDALADKDSVKNLGINLKDAIQYARQRNDLLKEQTSIQDTINNREKSLASAQVYLTDLQLKLKGIQDESSDEWQEQNKKVQEQQTFVKALQDDIEQLQENLDGVTEKINKGTQAWLSFQKGMANVAQYIDATKQAIEDIFDGIGAVFNIDDATRDAFESVSEIIGGISKTANGLAEIDLTRPFTLITGLGKAIGGVFSTIGGFFGIGDKKKERDIQKLTEKVETLDKAYQNLEKSIEKAYTFSDYNAGYKQMQQNLEGQKQAYEEMIRLEEAKKKTDDEKIKEYKEKLQEIADAQEELRKSRIEAMGSTTDYLSEAQSFVDAWLDAYKETGSGIDALGDKWEEFIENLFVKQGAAQIVSSRLKGIIDTINTAIDAGATDFDLADAVNKAREDWKKQAEIIEPLLEQLFGKYGLAGDNTGELILSDLQKGIQNITEPQAAAIEAYLNSMRFAVFRHTEQLDTLIATIQMQYGSGAENPVVTELKGIRGVLDNIDRRLASVINTQGRNATIRIGAN